MQPEIIISPTGHLRMSPANDVLEPFEKKIVAAFSESDPRGLLALLSVDAEMPLPASWSFWRSFATLFLTALCRMNSPAEPTAVDEPISAPLIFDIHEALGTSPKSEFLKLLESAPPMTGGEYLNESLLESLWARLKTLVVYELNASDQSIDLWLKNNAPAWHQVGRVCFHLAENKNYPEYPFAFLATYASGVSKAGKVQYLPLHQALSEYSGEKNKTALINLLSPIEKASLKCDYISEMVETRDIFYPIAWTPDEAYRFLKTIPELLQCGLLLKFPDWWRKSHRSRPCVSVKIGERKQSLVGLSSMLDFKMEFSIDGRQLTREELEQILAAGEGLTLIRGKWVEVDADRLKAVLNHWEGLNRKFGKDGISFIEGMRLLSGVSSDMRGIAAEEDIEYESGHGEWAFVESGKWLTSMLNGLRDPSSLKLKINDTDFNGTLRHYQVTGRNWLWFLSNLGLGACLADDMGLGKTIQVISLLLALKNQPLSQRTPSLLVLPASLLSNWKAEIARFAPSLKAIYVHPSEMNREEMSALSDNFTGSLDGVDAVLTTYGMLQRQSWLLDIPWRLLIIDEAQAIKNSGTSQTRAVKKIKAQARIALTGTPIENRLSDLWSLFDFLNPGLLGSAERFKQFTRSLQKHSRCGYAPLRNLVGPYIMRRLKTDKNIISDLPDKTEMKAYCGLSREQVALYSHALEELRVLLTEVEGIERRGLVLAFLMRLKQICNHPSHFLKDGRFEHDCSGKFKRLSEICEEISSRQEKVIVFTQFREMTVPISTHLSGIFRQAGLILHGGTAVKRRKKLVDMFQDQSGPPFFVLSLKAGGVGLNLTEASHVIHFDRWWNPAVENQATDRAFRIGQHRNVVVQKFICRGTVEEKIDKMIDEKISLADDILKAGAESMLTEMNDAELMKTVALDIDRAQIG